MPSTILEYLYKCIQQAYNNYKKGCLLRVENFVPTASKVATVEAKVSDIAPTKAIDAIKQTVRSGRHMKPLQKVKLNIERCNGTALFYSIMSY